MAFDRTNQADLTALKNEVELDPLGMGYATAQGTQALLDLLNDPANNIEIPKPTGPDFVTPKKLLDALFPVSISSQDQFKIQLIFESALNSDEDISIFRDDVASLGAQLSTAVNGITRELSRAEALFADSDANGSTENVIISREDWFEARDNG